MTTQGSRAVSSRVRLAGLISAGLALVLLAAIGSSSTASAQTPVPTVVITLSPATLALSCGANTAVTVNMTVGGAAAPNGTSITITANIGMPSPATVVTNNGSGTFTYNAPPSGTGTAMRTASSMGGSGSANITLFCGSGGPPSLPGAALAAPVVVCTGQQANVTFSWTPVAGADVQWVDLSLLNNAFAGDSFVGFGPLAGNANSIQWNGLLPGRTHWWRVSAGVPGTGWVFSQTGAFTPCGTNPAPGTTTFVCIGGGRANVTFGVGAPPGGTTASFVDISLFNNGFAPGSFVGANASGVTTSFVWTGILANSTHWWRVNNLTPFGWIPSTTRSFTATC